MHPCRGAKIQRWLLQCSWAADGKMSMVGVKSSKGEGINCTGESRVHIRGGSRRVRASAPARGISRGEAKPIRVARLRCLHRIIWKCLLISVSDLRGANKISQFASSSERHTGSFSSFFLSGGRIPHLSCQSSENLAWQWWMPSHEAERCLTYLVKGGELVSEWEQKQEEKGALESVMLLALRQVLSFCFFKPTGRDGRGAKEEEMKD